MNYDSLYKASRFRERYPQDKKRCCDDNVKESCVEVIVLLLYVSTVNMLHTDCLKYFNLLIRKWRTNGCMDIDVSIS